RFDQLAADFAEALRGDILLVIELPDLVLALVIEAGVFGIFHLHTKLIELISAPRSGRCGGLIAAAAIMFDEVIDVRIYDLRGELGTRRLESDVHQAAV